MEIEIGESLCLSYLKHVKKCVIYQTNWKLSSWWLQELGKKSPAENLYDKLKESPSKEKTAATDFDVKDVLTSDFSQFLKQAEIDALGVDKDGNVYAIIFASPKVDAAKQDLIMPALEELQADARFKDNGITFEYIANDKFKAEILDQTIEASRNDADTNELFLRSYKLLNLPYTEAKSTKKKASSSASSSLETGS